MSSIIFLIKTKYIFKKYMTQKKKKPSKRVKQCSYNQAKN